jgi:hypothetical protein
MVMSKCEGCNHRNICKYKDEYERVLREITVKVPEPFTLTLCCSHYYSSMTYLNCFDQNGCTNSTAYSNASLSTALD